MNIDLLLWVIILKLFIGGTVKFIAGGLRVEKKQQSNYDFGDAIAGLCWIILGIIVIVT